jgi:DNA-binding protein
MDVCSDNTVYIGRKFFMRYVLAVLMKFNVFKCSTTVIKAVAELTISLNICEFL